jgi:hypothetical protein
MTETKDAPSVWHAQAQLKKTPGNESLAKIREDKTCFLIAIGQ